jgi:two-component system nitrate/nitrite response regulator NarL
MSVSTKRVKVLLADDHPIVRAGIKLCLSSNKQFEVVGEAIDGQQALEAAERLRPDIILMDINMPKMSGIDACRVLMRKHPEIKVIILTVHDKKEYVLEIMRSGARGYVLKEASEQELLQAIDSVLKGGAFFSPKISRFILEHHSHGQKSTKTEGSMLSPKEREVLALIAKEFKNKEIAEQFGVSVRTIETYRERIMQKLDIHTVAGLTKFAITEGVIVLE